MVELKPCPLCGREMIFTPVKWRYLAKNKPDELHWDCRIAQLEAEPARLQEKLHDEMGQLKIATDLGNKRWLALNDIYENGEKHNSNWCKRKAQEGLGIK